MSAPYEAKEWIDCWQCWGEGGWHDCGESTCCCSAPDELTKRCDVCDGEGGWMGDPDEDMYESGKTASGNW